MSGLIWITQTVFCLVSMILTGMFALSLSGISYQTLSVFSVIDKTLLLAVLFVLIGCCIDIGKYLFWIQRQRSAYFRWLSIALMLFSWQASCAFLISSESGLLKQAQTMSVGYVTLQYRIENLDHEIKNQQQLLHNRLASRHHKQWQAGQEGVEAIATLQETRLRLIEALPSTGKETAIEQVATSHFFSQISGLLDISVGVVRMAGYGALGLLLELSTLGVISLGRTRKSKGMNEPIEEEAEVSCFIPNSEQQNLAAQQTIIRLTCDILSGQMPPVVRKIKTAKYGLQLSIIQQLLKNLHQIGLLEQGKRNSYSLSVAIKNEPS